MARLILLNGPPGIGKSTYARQWASDQPATVVVDIDELRTSIDGWREDDRTRLTAREMALAEADSHLRSGTDVVIPQYLGRTEFIVELERAADAAGAQFVEVYLVADAAEVAARFEARRGEPLAEAHPQHEIEDIEAAVADAVARLSVVMSERSGASTVEAGGDPTVTFAQLCVLLAQ